MTSTKTIAAAISQSVAQTEIVTLDFDVEGLEKLKADAEDWVEGNRCFEFWGIDQGGEQWRVHMRKEVR